VIGPNILCQQRARKPHDRQDRDGKERSHDARYSNRFDRFGAA
jgi:hypothetical protein